MRTVHPFRHATLKLVPALAVMAAAVLLSLTGLFEPIEDALTSQRATLLNRTATGQVAIVEIDAQSLAQLRSWPWPREYHAALIRQLHRDGASIIAFDVDFSARSTGKGDEALAAAIHDGGQIILPIFDQRSSTRENDRRVTSSRPDAAFEGAWVGGVNIFPDADGLVRDYPAATVIAGAIQPSIATLLAEKNGLGDRSFQPDWSIDVGSIPRFSFVDVMNGRVPDSVFRGKRVLVGATAIEMGDRYAVPRYGVVPGVVVQALAAESLLQNRAVQKSGTAVTLLGILLLALLLWPRPLERPARFAVSLVGAVGIVVAGPVVAQKFWPISIDTAPWLFSIAAALLVQAAFEARRRLRLRDEQDAESGLPNRSMLEKALLAESDAAPIVVTVGIERYETIRDGLGLAATSEMIRRAAHMIGAAADRAVYRIAPDTLAWSIPDTDEKSVQQALRRVQSAFREPVQTASGPVDVSFTLGLARHERGAPVLQIQQALSAVGAARAAGKPSEWYRGSNPQLRRQLSMMSDVRVAMTEGRLRLEYQAKMSLKTNRISDAEALIRWFDTDGNRIPPDEFIPLAEETGVISEITLFALRTAAAQLARWSSEGIPMRVAVNVSAIDLANPGFAEEVASILAASGAAESQLSLEVTESALLRSPDQAIATLNHLRGSGIRLSVDDYGTGQSTLSYLKRLPVHELKIDRSFISEITSNSSDQIMVRSTIDLAHELGLEVVAEGIEDAATLQVLRDLNCDYAQGYLISRPLAPEDFIRMANSGWKAKKAA